jgi:hypothetical protein
LGFGNASVKQKKHTQKIKIVIINKTIVGLPSSRKTCSIDAGKACEIDTGKACSINAGNNPSCVMPVKVLVKDL